MSNITIKVPPLGESVTEATISRWYKKTGESILEGEIILELETDKVTLEVNAPSTGTLAQISAKEGDTVAIGDVLGTITQGEASFEGGILPKEDAVVQSEGSPQKESLTFFTNSLAMDLSSSGGDVKNTPKNPTTTSAVSNIPQAGPAARKMMEELGILATDISGTGKDGRVTKGDILESNKQETPLPHVFTHTVSENASIIGQEPLHTPEFAHIPHISSSFQPVESTQRQESTRKPMTQLRKKIAERLKHAQNTAAILTTFNECDMSAIMDLRKTYQDAFVKKYGTKLGFMSFFVKACVHALKEIPSVNGEIDGDEMVFHNRYDIGVAVSAPQGLVVPILRGADILGLHAIEMGIASFGEKAKSGKLAIADLTGGTFTISNGGTFGSLVSTPILNPPQSAILGMHKIQERPVVVGGQIVIRPMMYLALSYDHRMIDGREAVTFLVRVKESLENPARMLLGL